jgi:hypothetical protein
MTDDHILEAAARNMCSRDFPAKWDFISKESREWYCDLARNSLAAATPLIRAAALEEAAQRIEADEEDYLMRNYVAAAIRTLMDRP